MKHLLKIDLRATICRRSIVDRRDKMGFPVPLKEWFGGELRDFVGDIFTQPQRRSRARSSMRDAVLANFDKAERFSRKIWGLLSLELWHQLFHDRAARVPAHARATSEPVTDAAQ